ncbi:type II toxin-antitoxin system RelE/ParE family toxin [bacterium]|nr:type II toxin-antitoxin system RelE/ParE family toxin [bacterium]
MNYRVQLTTDAKTDLAGIVGYIRVHDSLESAQFVYDKLRATIDSLKSFPNRGTVVEEARQLGEDHLREVFFKPYRILYEVADNRVIVYLIADGRRNMQELLAKRLLG